MSVFHGIATFKAIRKVILSRLLCGEQKLAGLWKDEYLEILWLWYLFIFFSGGFDNIESSEDVILCISSSDDLFLSWFHYPVFFFFPAYLCIRFNHSTSH